MLKVSEILLCIPFKRRFVLFSFICVQECDLSADALRCQKRVLNPLELELQATVSRLTWCWQTDSGLQSNKCFLPLSHLSSPLKLKKKNLQSVSVHNKIKLRHIHLHPAHDFFLSLNFSVEGKGQGSITKVINRQTESHTCGKWLLVT